MLTNLTLYVHKGAADYFVLRDVRSYVFGRWWPYLFIYGGKGYVICLVFVQTICTANKIKYIPKRKNLYFSK
jgi:hypothetical protein